MEDEAPRPRRRIATFAGGVVMTLVGLLLLVLLPGWKVVWGFFATVCGLGLLASGAHEIIRRRQ